MIPVVSGAERSAWQSAVRRRTEPLIDYELGGPVLGTTGDLSSTQWVAYYEGGDVLLRPLDELDATILVSAPDVTRVAMSFDIGMDPYVAYTVGDATTLRLPDSTTVELPGVTDPCMTLDERRPLLSGDSDVILCYTRAGSLYARLQRDRFLVEHLLAPALGTLTAFAMNSQNRLQWRFKP